MVNSVVLIGITRKKDDHSTGPGDMPGLFNIPAGFPAILDIPDVIFIITKQADPGEQT
jgi:hypothetical protein